MQNLNIFLKVGAGERLEIWSAACLSSCPLVQVVQGAVAPGVSFRGVFRPFLPAFCPFAALASCNTCEICLISHFKRVLAGFFLFRVCLLGLGALRGLWGFCVRVRLGGFMACCVFCLFFCQIVLQNLSFCLSFSSLVLFRPLLAPFVLLLSCFPAWLLLLVSLGLCGLSFGLGWVVGFLSLSDGFRYEKRGANCVPSSVGRVVGLICKKTTRAVRLYICNAVFLCEFATIAKVHKIRDVFELSYSVKSESLCLAPEL